jgi:hypothetical protein
VVSGKSAGEIQLHSIRHSILFWSIRGSPDLPGGQVWATQTAFQFGTIAKLLDDFEFIQIHAVTVEGASAATRLSTSFLCSSLSGNSGPRTGPP